MPNTNASTERINKSLQSKPLASFNPTSSTNQDYDFKITLDEAITRCLSSDEQSPVRGRTLERVSSMNRSRSRATTRPYLTARSTYIDMCAIRSRLMSRDLTAEPNEYGDDSLFEPLPFDGFRSHSLSEELHRAATFDSSIDLTTFGGHRDTFAIMGFRHLHNKVVDLPKAFYECLVHHVDFNTYKTLRLICRNWCEAITRARPITLPPVLRLPAEVLGKIHARLEPADFNSARHTCRAWMVASLEEKLLIQKLKAGGWWSAARLDMAKHEDAHGAKRLSVVNEDWLLSKRLATECALLPGWTGNGLAKDIKLDGHFDEKCNRTGLKLTSETDFSNVFDIGHGREREHENKLPEFTVSVCQKYLLITNDSIIYIYSLRAPNGACSHEYGGYIQPLTSVVCPSRILAVSMDTSSDRYAVAVLLEGRIGLVYDIDSDLPTPKDPDAALIRPFTLRSPRSCTFALASNYSDPDRMSWTSDDHTSLAPLSSPHSGIPLSTGPHTTYHNICFPQEPPHSIAICPQRRCVAFGNSAGIELHWTDALSGQDLQRWFPLTTGSDFVYFLSNQSGCDSGRKLRVLSSAAHPDLVHKVADSDAWWLPPPPPPPPPDTTTHVMLARRRTWGLATEEKPDALNSNHLSHERRLIADRGKVQHYNAVPLSDGYNILFTDPATGNLCLGPVGLEQDTSHLSQCFIFHGPHGVVPHRYATAAELRWGVRIAAAYREEVWFFCVAPDLSPSLHHASLRDKENAQDMDRDGTCEGEGPITIEGVKIGNVPGLIITLAVDASNGDLGIWAFGSRRGYVWQLRGEGRGELLKRSVCGDGSVVFLKDEIGDEDGDIEMGEAWEWDVESDHRPPSSLEYDDAMFSRDREGDLIMTDPTTPTGLLPVLNGHGHEGEDEGYISDDMQHTEYQAAGGQFAIHVPPLHGRWSDGGDGDEWVPEYLGEWGIGIEDEGLGVDLVEVSRVEVEVMGS